jgi:hypothetical protein
MGLTNWRGDKVRKQDIITAKNYLSEDELKSLNNLIEQYLVFAEGQAMRRITMTMADWLKKLDGFLSLNDRNILDHAGKISHQMAKQQAEQEYKQFHHQRLSNEIKYANNVLDDLTKTINKIPSRNNK